MHSEIEMANKLPEESCVKNLAVKPSLRPVDYTREIGSTICDRLFDGETLSQICRDAAMPDKPTVMRWLGQYPEFLDEYVFTGQLREELARPSPPTMRTLSAGSAYGARR
jgi:hypothetical protein